MIVVQTIIDHKPQTVATDQCYTESMRSIYDELLAKGQPVLVRYRDTSIADELVKTKLRRHAA